MKTILLIFSLFFYSSLFAQTTVEEWTAKAEAAVADGDYKQAIECYTNALAIKPNGGNQLFRRGFAYTVQKEYQKAIADFTEVIRINPEFIWAYISRGSAYNKTKDFQKGLADFNKAISMDPKNQEAYNNRGWSKKGMGDEAGACSDWNQSKKLGNEEAKLILKTSGCK